MSNLDIDTDTNEAYGTQSGRNYPRLPTTPNLQTQPKNMKRSGLLTINEPDIEDDAANCLDETIDTSVKRSVCYTDAFE